MALRLTEGQLKALAGRIRRPTAARKRKVGPTLPASPLSPFLGLPEPIPEYRFAPPRKWRFDWAWPAYRVAVEQEGGVWIQGRHSRGAGMIKDMLKYNTAAAMGWRVFRFTPQQVRDGTALELVRETLLKR